MLFEKLFDRAVDNNELYSTRKRRGREFDQGDMDGDDEYVFNSYRFQRNFFVQLARKFVAHINENGLVELVNSYIDKYEGSFKDTWGSASPGG